MGLREDQALEMLRNAFRNGHIGISINSDGRKDTIKKLLMVADGGNISSDVFEAIRYYIDEHQSELKRQKEKTDQHYLEKMKEIEEREDELEEKYEESIHQYDGK